MRPDTGTWWVGASLPGPGLRGCLEAAIAAPSIHNTQPWRFRIRDDGVDVLADRSRRLGVLDPDGRELLISVGAAVFNLRVAMLARGRTPVVRLLPGSPDPDLVARVSVGAPVRVSPTARLLDQAIARRRSNRRPFADIAVPAEVLTELADAVAAEGGTLTVLDPLARARVLDLVRRADDRWRHDPAYWAELGAWTRQRPGRRDGVPAEAFGPWSVADAVPIRDFGLVQPVAHRWTVPFEPAPTLAVLGTAGDGRHDWLRAGQALQRALLTGTVRGLSSSLLSQPLEVPELRAALADGARPPQMIVRWGYGRPSAPSPRRPVLEVLAPPAVVEPIG